MIHPLRALILATVAVAALFAAGCGNKEEVVTEGKTEGIYLDVGELKYQVQISRQLNPSDTEDREYLTALSPLERALAPGETWFGVFVRVQNDTEDTHALARRFSIEDTTGKIFLPTPLGINNGYAYRPASGPLQPKAVLPKPNSTAGYGPSGGALLLFKMKNSDLANRPLVLTIVPPEGGAKGHVDLDV
ncbi:MAG: hypothetical protein JHC95_04260 [Solirubrobacteraceae bacterium]|nr:hypothetical protein [Solirubrobacteraceae bacterium]